MTQHRYAKLVLAACGVLLISYLLWRNDFSDVMAETGILGSWILALALWRLGIIAVMACGWRCLLVSVGDGSLLRFICFRWVAESVNTLLPVAQVGGELVRTRLAGRLVPAGKSFAAASVVADMTINLLGQALLVGVGASQVWNTTPDRGLLLLACAAAFLPVAGIVYAQRAASQNSSSRLFGRLKPGFGKELFDAALPFADGLRAIYANNARLMLATISHVIAGFARALEVWLILALLQHRVSFLDAIMIEGLSSAVRTAAFVVPAGLGIQEGALILVCAWAGVPAVSALALAAAKRVRELLVGVLGLAVWAYLEGRHSVAAE